jgi:SP family galactose:H+ symporter-like MFS transporter
MFLVIAAFSLIMFIGSFRLPESPRWLMLKGRKTQAREVLVRVLCHDEDIDRELADIDNAIKSDKGAGVGIIFKGYFFKVLLMGVILQMFQQLVGINMMIYYAPTIFGYAGMKGLLAMLTVPTVNMLFTFPAIKLVEKWGRKKLLYVGAVVMMITMIAAGLAFASIGGISDPSQIGGLPKAVLLIAVIIYIFGFAVSWGPVAWIVCSEVFPLEGREVGMTITTIVNWSFAGLVMGNALSFMRDHGNASIFFVFAAFCVVSMLFLKFFVPETKGVTLEKLESDLKSGKALRDLGN